MATTENQVPAQAEDNVSKPGASGSGSGSDTEVPKESESSKGDWAFKNSEPLREDQIQNAVKFLSHPKVRGSPVVHRRSFLERKGLTKEEIDEAFTRVPDPPTSDVPAVLPARTQTQDAKPPLVAAAPTQQPGNMNQYIIPGAVPQPIAKANQFTWRNVVFAIGFLAATGAGTGFLFKKTIVPKMKTWIRKVISDTDDHEQKKVLQPDPAAEAAAAAKSAAEAAAAVAIATQELLKNKSEDRKYFEGLVQTLEEQVEEMKYIKISVQSNENNKHNISVPAKCFDGVIENGKHNGSSGMVSSMNQNSKTNYTPVLDQGSARPSSAPPTGMPSRAPYSKSYMEVMEMISRGEKPPGIQDINDKPPNPNQPPSASQLQSRPKPWEKEQSHMLNRGSERNGYSDMHIKSPGSITNASGDSEPWWQHKSSDTAYKEPRSQFSDGNATKSKFDSAQEKINGNESEIHLNNFATGEQKSQGSSSFLNSGSRNWVPPQAPPLSMPQAFEAIRNPKTKMRKDVWDSKSEVSSDSLSDVQSGPNDGTLTSPDNQDPEHVYSQSESQDYAKDNKPVMESSTHTEIEPSDHSLQDTVTEGVKELEDVQA